MKRILRCSVLLITLLMLICTGFTASADDGDYGTKELGVVSGALRAIWSSTPAREPTNLDWSQGFMYWGTEAGISPSAIATVSNIDGVNAISLSPTSMCESIQTVPFYIDGTEPFDRLAIVFDWQGDISDVTVRLNQTNGGSWLTNGESRLLKENADGWNTSVTRVTNYVRSGNTDYAPKFSVVIGGTFKPQTYISNIRIVKLGEKDELLDIEGNVSEYKNPYYEPSETENDIPEKTTDNTDSERGGFSKLYIIIITAAVIVGLSLILVIIIIKNNRSKSVNK